MKVAVIDYGMGNILSVQRALEKVGAEVDVVSTPAGIEAAEKLVLPGVGSFPDGMDELHKKDLVRPIRNHAKAGKPLLGICLGMQMLFDSSTEWKFTPGLGLIPGEVSRLAINKLPNIGWLDVNKPEGWDDKILWGIPGGARFYFLHSYVANAGWNEVASAEIYGVKFCAVARKGSVVGVQFHPEKSGENGLALLTGFVRDGQDFLK